MGFLQILAVFGNDVRDRRPADTKSHAIFCEALAA
ncbi:hypothetical protein MAXJ12_24087 [Mesorhizobium alhagi CCNWXJ12-2]|uniref:Uncharacterized protein n=1 Tax=Mesorhizobium alhagi CCNWXJ12-2 TaxID=1107882 RepID=H0HX98_9HYPH|nr:hypothetical protein MAXJ12_24087 [Mesorhizobium alhagi CCNWXJ12-2]